MSIINNGLLLAAEAAAAGGYTIDRSLRFSSADSAFLSRTPASAGNRKTWTWAGWVKRSGLGAEQNIFDASYTSSQYNTLNFTSTDKFRFLLRNSSGLNECELITTQVFRDPSSWYHIIVACDTSQGAASNRAKIYVNGVQVTAFDTATYPALNFESNLNNAGVHEIGRNYNFGSSQYAYFSGYLADIHFIDGQALDPTSFGEFDTNGVWQPLAYEGSYGTNGFHLDFADNSSAAALGYDAAGSNDWTVNNLIVTDGTVSVAGATGGLPIYNTTDTYGTVKGTGTRTDSSSASIVLALPMDGTNNGTTFTDESATIKGSGSAKTLTRNGDTKTVTSQSKFYGSSGYFDGTGDYLSGSDADYAFGTGDFTIECWVYVDSIAEQNFIATRGTAGSTTAWSFAIGPTGTLYLYSNAMIATSSVSLVAQQWTHVAASRSGTTCRLFVNGVQVGSGSNSQNFSTQTLGIGSAADGTQFPLTGNMQDVRVYKGTAKYTSNFNPPSSTANATLAAGNDSLRDSPTNGDTANDTGLGGQVPGNYCTWNPLIYRYSAADKAELSNGNLDALFDATAHGQFVYGTISVSTGKWYFEYLINNTGGGGAGVGVANYGHANNNYSLSRIYQYSGNKYDGTTSTSYGASYANGDIVGVALDMDNGTLVFYKNGSSQGTAFSDLLTLSSVTVHGSGDNNSSFTLNAGQRPFAYSAPSGFKALCTTNLPTPTIADGSTAMDVSPYSGNSGTTTISGLGFSPDLAWLKGRSQADRHYLFDTVRGKNALLASNETTSETDYSSLYPNYLQSFNSDGFTLGYYAAHGGLNKSGETYVAWTWDESASAGFDIVPFTATRSGSTWSGGDKVVSHSLGVKPGFIIWKARTVSNAWECWHTSTGNNKVLYLNTTSAAVDAGSPYCVPTSSNFTLTGSSSGSIPDGTTADFIAYCFAPVAGYSAFGSFNIASSSDNFIYTGFRPRFLLYKYSNTTGNWAIFDTARNTYNVADYYLFANSSGAEGTSANWDFLSNGFKLRNSLPVGNTVIWAAFAEHPFQTARAR